MMSPWQEPRYIRRVWCVFEFSIAIKERKELTVLMPQAEKDSFRLALFETGLQGIYDVLASLRIQDASASVEEDKINILKSIDPDAIDYNDSAKVGALNTKVRQRIQQWLVNTAVQWLEDRTRETPAEVKHSVFNSVGSLLIESVADFSNAEVILRQGLEVHSKQSLDGALGLRLLGRLVVRQQDWEGARSYYMEAKARLETLGSARTVQYAQLLVDLFTTTGQEEFLFSAKELFDSLEATSHEDYPRVLKHLGSLKLAGGDPVGAMEYYELAAESYQELKMERSPGFADLLTNLGKAEMECASRDKAREAYEASKHIYGVIGVTESPGYADLLVNLGMLHKEEDRVSEALAEFKAAASIYATSSPGGTALPELWAQIGSCHEKRGAFDAASEAYDVARVSFEKAGETEHDTYKEVLARSQADDGTFEFKGPVTGQMQRLVGKVRDPLVEKVGSYRGGALSTLRSRKVTEAAGRASKMDYKEPIDMLHEPYHSFVAPGAAEEEKRLPDGSTPLFCAAQQGKAAVARLLLQSGANPKVETINGDSPLFAAAQKGHIDVVQVLLEFGAATNEARRQDGVTPLFAAAQRGFAEVVRVLLDADAALEQPRYDSGATPLYIAAQKGYREVVKVLADYGADTDTVALDHGATPLYVAAQNGHESVVRMLLEVGAKRDKGWDHEQYYTRDPLKDQDPAQKWKTHCNHGTYIEGLELFDNKMFKISNLEAGGMDPNQRQALEVFYETTLSAGLDEKRIMRSNIGVFMGGPGGIPEFAALPKDDSGGALGSTNNSPAIMANRISFCMGIHGPNFFIDLEGSASLIAFNLAVDSIQPDKAQCVGSVALGVDCNVHPQGLLQLSWANVLSKKGRCLSFDTYADGYIRGEGFTGLYVNPLKKEVDGKRVIDEDPPIIGLASGGYINNNGRSASLSAPSGAMYQELVANSVRSADVSPLDVEAVECNAAGHVLSDAVEATALVRAYRSLATTEDNEEEEVLGLLSGKSNYGHMRPAAGVAALLRVIVGQAMGCMPPSLHLHKLNPHIIADDGVPMFLATEHVAHRMSSAFVACTACGIGGSNAHAILWGRACTRQVKMEKAVQAEEVLSFWPGGGGELDPACEPRRGCSISGSWNLPDQCERMRGEGLDQFCFTLTLGEHGCEWFQIWLDGEKDRVLHPGSLRGAGEEKVQGPHAFCQAQAVRECRIGCFCCFGLCILG
ncbi:pikAII [Symbiodinium sp. KB8]|nr:pikAII [Symbiodinium sp. KB8]